MLFFSFLPRLCRSRGGIVGMHIQTLLCRRPWGGRLHAVKMIVQAAMVARRKTTAVLAVSLATTTIGGTTEERGTRENGRGITVGNLGGNPPHRTVGGMSPRGASRLTTVSPPIWRIVLGSRLRPGSLVGVKGALALRPIRETRIPANPSRKIRAIRRGPIITSSNNTNSTKNAVGVTMTVN